MTIVRDYFNSFKNTDFVDGFSEIGLQYGYINSRNDFNIKSTSQTAIIFDKDVVNTTLLPQVNRGDHSATQAKERNAESFALKLAYFKHNDRITADDIQGARVPKSTDLEDIQRATAEKMTDMMRTWNQTQEYMKLQAKKGIFKTPDGTVMANMFTEFGISQTSIDFVLGTSTTNLDQKIRQMKSAIAKNVMNGGAIGGVEVMVDPSWFDKFISHANMKQAYASFASQTNLLRDDLSKYEQWGVQDYFTHRGVTFLSYDATFNLPNGTTELAFAADTGIATAVGVKDLFRGYYGPSNKLSGANQAGQELFVSNYVDPKDEFVDLTIESAPLYFCTRPASLIAVTSSN
jgi:hypothetical protein